MQDSKSIHRFAHEAMATSFELFIATTNPDDARHAAHEAFRLIDRLESLLSRFDPRSDIAQLNRVRHGQSVRVAPDVFECLAIAVAVSCDTGGAFDPSIGPAIKCWRDDDGTQRSPTDAELAAARLRTGMARLELDRDSFSVSLRPDDTTEGIVLDLGAIGKGFALDRIADLFEEWDIKNALLNAGSSTVLALGSPGDQPGWSVAVGGDEGTANGISPLALSNEALSGSGIELQGGHILDPATGSPATAHCAAWAACPSATVADALSTAFMVMPTNAVRAYCAAHAATRAWVVPPEGHLIVLPN